MKKQKLQEGVPGFRWPSSNDHLKIAENSKRYQDMDIADAFADYYNLSLKKTGSAANTPPEFKIGEYVNLVVLGADKKHLTFEQTNFKEEILCTVNLAQYPRFKNLTEPVEISCRVVSKTDNSVLVDPIYWFYDQFITVYVKNPSYQYNIKDRFQPFTAKNLRLVRGGFMGSLKLDNASDFFGKDIWLDVFIPGSQIVVNVEENFERWVGKDVPFYIINLIEKPGTDNKIVVGSPKEFYKLNARLELMDIFNHYCLDDDEWKKLTKEPVMAKVTGVVHTASKCGVFVEINNITGLIECEPEMLVKYAKGSEIPVRYKGFNELMTYNSMVDQMQHVPPYIVEDDILKKFNLKVTFEFAE